MKFFNECFNNENFIVKKFQFLLLKKVIVKKYAFSLLNNFIVKKFQISFLIQNIL